MIELGDLAGETISMDRTSEVVREEAGECYSLLGVANKRLCSLTMEAWKYSRPEEIYPVV